jgi:hypothetical protein
MVDSTTIVLVASIAQTIVLTLTLVVFMFQFRSQEKAIQESSYQNLMGRYNDFIMRLIDRPELAKLLVDRIPGREPGAEVKDEEATVYGQLLVIYGIIEEAYLLYKKKWIDEATWQQWAAWMRSMATRPEMKQILEVTSGSFDGDFERFVSNLLNEKKPGQAERRQQQQE